VELTEAERRSLLRDEYNLLQNQYDAFDGRALVIKGWIGSGAITALAISFTANGRLLYIVPIFVIIVALVFWYLETKWKMFQYALRARIVDVEGYFRGEKPDLNPLQIYSTWVDGYSRYTLIAVGSQAFVAALYVTIISLSLISLILFPLR
jgi:hypothetical protein